MDDKTLIITTEDGKEITTTILFTYHSDEFNKDYVVFEDDKGIISAASYIPSKDGMGELSDIESDAEWNMLEHMLNESQEEEDK